MTTALVLCLLQVPTSGAAGVSAPSAHSRAQEVTALRVSAPENCPAARKAVRYYESRLRFWAHQMGAGTSLAEGRSEAKAACPHYLAHVLQRKAHAARIAYGRWHEYHYAWRKWMPAKHQRVAQCETGYQGGTGPGGSRWDWDSGTYVSAFGIYRQGYDDDAHRVGNLGWDETIRRLGRYPTPREQMQAADSHRAAHGGWSGWGCRGA